MTDHLHNYFTLYGTVDLKIEIFLIDLIQSLQSFKKQSFFLMVAEEEVRRDNVWKKKIMLVCRWRGIRERECRWPLKTGSFPRLTASKDVRPQNYNSSELNSANRASQSHQIEALTGKTSWFWLCESPIRETSSVCSDCWITELWAYRPVLFQAATLVGIRYTEI